MNKLIASLAISSIVALIIVVTYIVSDVTEEVKFEKEETSEQGPSYDTIVGEEDPNVEVEGNFADLLTLHLNSNTTEADIQNTIHRMSHQKVIAEAKRGKVPLTKKTVNDLQGFLMDSSANKYAHINLYRSIVNKWASGDFTSIHKDHNVIWDLQNGQIGYATSTGDAMNEKAYILHNYGEGFYEFLKESGELLGQGHK